MKHKAYFVLATVFLLSACATSSEKPAAVPVETGLLQPLVKVSDDYAESTVEVLSQNINLSRAVDCYSAGLFVTKAGELSGTSAFLSTAKIPTYAEMWRRSVIRMLPKEVNPAAFDASAYGGELSKTVSHALAVNDIKSDYINVSAENFECSRLLRETLK